MKIIEIIPQLGQGGAERFVIDLCNELSKHNEVILVSLYNMDKHGFFKDELSPNVKLICMNKQMGIDFQMFFQLYKFIKKEKPDVVHTHLRCITYTILAFTLLTKIKFIHTVHNDAYKEAGDKLSIWCRLFAFKHKFVHPITISEESQKSFEQLYHIPSTLIYNGRPAYNINTAHDVTRELIELKANKESKLVVNIARIQDQKNQIALAKAINNLNNKGHAIELVIIGSKADSRIVHEIEALKSPFIHLLGTRVNPRDYMIAADAFCLSSKYEGMPITLIECFSVGAIPLCTPVGGIINMIQNGVNGLLSKGTGESEIEELLLNYLDLSIEKEISIKEKSKETFQLFDMEMCTNKYLEVINKL